MHFLKLSVMVAMSAMLGAGSLAAQSNSDTDAQARAREEERKAAANLEAGKKAAAAANASATNGIVAGSPMLTPEQQAAVLDALHKTEDDLDEKKGIKHPPRRVVPQTVNVPMAAPAPMPTPALAPSAPAAIATFPGGLSPADEIRIREQLRQAEAQVDASHGIAPAPAPTPISIPAPVPPPAAPIPVAVAPPASEPIPAPTANVESEQRTRDQVHRALSDLDAQQPAVVVVAPMKPQMANSAPMPVKKNRAESVPGTPPPPAMVPGSKEQRLYDLLQLYRADKISPTEYHEQRAKIIAAP